MTTEERNWSKPSESSTLEFLWALKISDLKKLCSLVGVNVEEEGIKTRSAAVVRLYAHFEPGSNEVEEGSLVAAAAAEVEEDTSEENTSDEEPKDPAEA